MLHQQVDNTAHCPDGLVPEQPGEHSLWGRILFLIQQDLHERRIRKLFVEVRGESGPCRKEIGELSAAERRGLDPAIKEGVVERLLDRYLAQHGRVDLVDGRRTYTKKLGELNPRDLPALVEADRCRTEEERERAEFIRQTQADLKRLVVIEGGKDDRPPAARGPKRTVGVTAREVSGEARDRLTCRESRSGKVPNRPRRAAQAQGEGNGPYDKEKTMTDIVTKDELPRVIAKEELPYGTIAHKFEGYRYGDVDVSFFLVESPPGGGATTLHTHPYEEVFVTLEGEATFTVGDATIEASAGQIVVAPAGVPHKFVNSGSGQLRQVDIHPSGRIQQTNIPEDA